LERNLPFKNLQKKNDIESFWVIEDNYKCISRSKNNEFLCPDCTGIETTYGNNITQFHFENNKQLDLTNSYIK